MRGDPDKLIKEYAVDFCLSRAMDAAGYSGAGRIYEAARDIEERALFLRATLALASDDADRRERILREYERIAFAHDGDGVRTADKLKALEMYRALSEGNAADGGAGLVVKYDYGDEG